MYSAQERAMTKAKLFTTGGSQAVRLPAEFRFEESEGDIRRDPVTGELVRSPLASSPSNSTAPLKKVMSGTAKSVNTPSHSRR
jgi:virulence-associated protein VagC